jgi:hypothetical protein
MVIVPDSFGNSFSSKVIFWHEHNAKAKKSNEEMYCFIRLKVMLLILKTSYVATNIQINV